MKPVRFLKAKVTATDGWQKAQEAKAQGHSLSVIQQQVLEDAENLVEINYQATDAHGTIGDGMLDIVIRSDGKLNFVVWYPGSLLRDGREPFTCVTVEFDPVTGESKKIAHYTPTSSPTRKSHD